MKNLLKIISLFLITLLTSCENEKYEKYGESEKSETQAYLDLPSAPFSNKKYTVDELPKDIKGFYYKIRNINPNQSNQKASNTTDAIYAENSIVGNTDQKNNSNYSVGYFFEDTPKNIIYNLVINKDSTGTIIEKRYKYICNPSDYENFKSHNFDFKYFVGVTEVSSVPSNSSSKSTSKTADDTSPCVEALPCIRILPSAPSGSFGGSSSSEGTGFNTTVLGYNTSAGTGNYSATFGGTTYYSGGGSSSSGGGGSSACNDHANCIGDGYGGYNYGCGDLRPSHNHQKIKNNNKKTSGDPCDPCANNPLPTGYVPINLAPYYLQSIKSVIPFTKSQWLFLANNDAVVHQLWYSIDFNPTVLTTEYKQFVADVVESAKNESTQADVNNLVGLTLAIENSGSNLFEDNFALSLDQYVDLDLSTPPSTLTPNYITINIYLKYRLLRQLNTNWSPAHCLWEASKDIIHLSLDGFGLIPVGGEVADLINGVLYTIEGDGLNATFSYAGAVPFYGWAAVSTKYAVKIKTAYQTGNKVKLVWKVLADGTIYFGTDATCRAQLRKALGMVVDDGLQAHHIIPLNLQTNPIVQKAFKSADAFHLNEALNGIPLSNAVHNGSHFKYDGKISQKLKLFEEANPNATPSQCYNKVNEIISQIRTEIANNPNTPINQLNF